MTTFLRQRRLLAREDGITLILAVSVLTVLALTGATVVFFASANARSASHSNSNSVSYMLAEAGIDEAASILAKQGNNAFSPTLLPNSGAPKTSTYRDGTVTWFGTFDSATSIWTITSVGRVANPTGPGTGAVQRTVSAKIKVNPPPPAPPETQAWNYLYAGRTGNLCDMTLQQSGDIIAPLYVAGNLCLTNTATLSRGPVNVGGTVTLSQNGNSIGTVRSPVSEAHIGGGCRYRGGPLNSPCSAADNVFASIVDASPTLIPIPPVYWDDVYANASPGPFFPCTTQTGTPPVFDTAERIRNNSVPSVFNLTPSTSYSCKTKAGELSWDASARLLTANGTIFIDGSITANTNGVNFYTGQATIYTSGTFYIKTASLCAVSGTRRCDSTGWDPNRNLLIIVAGGNGGQVAPGDSIQFTGATFQGALYATNAIELDTTSKLQGPVVASTISLGQASDASFPRIYLVPPTAPGNTPIWSAITAPYDYSG